MGDVTATKSIQAQKTFCSVCFVTFTYSTQNFTPRLSFVGLFLLFFFFFPQKPPPGFEKQTFLTTTRNIRIYKHEAKEDRRCFENRWLPPFLHIYLQQEHQSPDDLHHPLPPHSKVRKPFLLTRLPSTFQPVGRMKLMRPLLTSGLS